MAVIEYDEYKQKLLALKPTLEELEKALGIPKAREDLAALQKETEAEGFLWKTAAEIRGEYSIPTALKAYLKKIR